LVAVTDKTLFSHHGAFLVAFCGGLLAAYAQQPMADAKA
jgi:hypothetical protein